MRAKPGEGNDLLAGRAQSRLNRSLYNHEFNSGGTAARRFDSEGGVCCRAAVLQSLSGRTAAARPALQQSAED